MKKILIAIAACVMPTVGALAADLAPAPLLAPPPPFSWTGFHVGVHVGAVYGGDRGGTRHVPGALFLPAGAGGAGSPFTGSFTTAFAGNQVLPYNGFLVNSAGLPVPTVVPLGGGCVNCRAGDRWGGLLGVHWGYNWQLAPGGGLVLGYQSDLQTLGLSKDSDTIPVVVGTTYTTPAFIGTPPTGLFGSNPGQLGPNTFTYFDPRATRQSLPQWFGTSRIRVGYAFDRLLAYVTGGLAYGGGFSHSHGTYVQTHAGTLWVPTGSCMRSDRCDGFEYGWTAGAGIEYALTNSFIAKVEGLYTDLGTRRESYGPVALQYAIMTGVGVAGGPATDRVVLSAPATAFSPRSDRLSSSFVVLRAGVSYKFNLF